MFVRNTQQKGDQPAVCAVTGRRVDGRVGREEEAIALLAELAASGSHDEHGDMWPVRQSRQSGRGGYSSYSNIRFGGFGAAAESSGQHSRKSGRKQRLDAQLPGRQTRQALGLTEPNMNPDMDFVPEGVFGGRIGGLKGREKQTKQPAADKIGAGGAGMV